MKSIATVLLYLVTTFSLTAQAYDIYFVNCDTDHILLNRPKQLELGLSTLVGGGGFAGQVGYSPIKHLSLAGGFYHSSASEDGGLESMRKKRGYSFSVGTYLDFSKREERIERVNPKVIKLSERRRLLLTAQLGFSLNEMNHFQEAGSSGFQEVDLEYQSLFLKLGLGYEYAYGLLNLTTSVRNVNYRKAVYGGINFDTDRVGDIIDQLRMKKNYTILGVGIHNQFGKKMIKAIAGATLPIVYFQEFKNQAASIENQSFYLGILIDIGETVSFLRKT